MPKKPADTSDAAATTPVDAPATAPVADDPSVLERVRRNRMGAPFTGLVVALGLGLLLSVLVPNEPSLLGLVLLGTAVAAAVGFAVRYLSTCRGLKTQLSAFVTTVIGVHVMTVTGQADIELPFAEQLGFGGPGWDEAVLIALATPALSAGAVIAGLVAAIIAGWGESSGHHRHHHDHDATADI